MRNRSGILIGLTVLAVAAAFISPAWATMDNLKAFKQVYPPKAGQAAPGCKVCHQSLIGKKGDLNAYGLALQKSKASADAKKITAADLKAIEKEDSDKDGVSNLDEINAGTSPGDPTSIPPTAGKGDKSK